VHPEVQPALTGATPSPSPGPSPGPSRGVLRAALCALLVVWLGALLHDLGTRPISPTAEQRCDDVMQEMVRSGDWLVPRRNGAVRLQKPPLAYWSASATAALTGRADRFLRLVSDSAPDALVRGLADDEAAGIAGLHFFPFGGVAKTARWANALKRGRFRANASGGLDVEV
jgi:hypothetical protein